MSVELVFIDALTCEFRHEGALLARYRAETGVPRKESPKPCLHPVLSLAGETVTDFQPADHPWHHGIAWAFTYINGDTFWGGPTFQDSEKGYGWFENHGAQRHIAWHEELTPLGAALIQTVHWLAANGDLLLVERRRLAATFNDAKMWQLHFASEFHNVTPSSLFFSSPVCHGRPEGGYFGLMWRGPPAWAYGRVYAATGVSELMGQTAAWIGYERRPTDGKNASLLFIDHPRNPRFPTTWFVRHQDQPLASFALAYNQPFTLAPGQTLRLQYTIAIVDSNLTLAEAETVAQAVWATT